MLRDASLVAAKDIRIEMRSKVALNQVAPFAIVVLLLFGFALGPDRRSLAPASAGLFWVAVLLSAVLAVERSFAIESADGARDALRLSGLDPGGIFIGKAAVVFAELIALEGLLTVGVALFYGARLGGALVLLGTCVAATAGLAAVGTVYGAVVSGVRGRETLLPLLFLPVVAPVLLGATKAWSAALSGRAGSGDGWLALLAAFAVVYVALGVVAFPPLLEEG
jgi:heme exporter protein B